MLPNRPASSPGWREARTTAKTDRYRSASPKSNFLSVENETWVTVAEWMQTTPPNPYDYTVCMKYGSDNTVFAARIQWKTPNQSWNQH